MNSGIGSAPLTAAAGGGTCSFVCNDANGYLVIITSTNDNLTGKSGAYYFRGMNKQIGQNKDPLVCELGTLNAPTWAFSYALQGTYNCTVTITTGVEAVAVQIIPLGVL
jgi:hypothetical protein